MKQFFFILLLWSIFNCSNSENALDITIYNPELTIIENLDNGASALSIIEVLGIDALYGLKYAGGYIYH